MQKAGVKPAQRPAWVPIPLPGNEDAYKAFHIVRNCRHITMNGAFGYNWQDCETKLREYGLWSETMIKKLSTFEDALLSLEHKMHEEKEEMKSTETKSKKRRGR